MQKGVLNELKRSLDYLHSTSYWQPYFLQCFDVVSKQLFPLFYRPNDIDLGAVPHGLKNGRLDIGCSLGPLKRFVKGPSQKIHLVHTCVVIFLAGRNDIQGITVGRCTSCQGAHAAEPVLWRRRQHGSNSCGRRRCWLVRELRLAKTGSSNIHT